MSLFRIATLFSITIASIRLSVKYDLSLKALHCLLSTSVGIALGSELVDSHVQDVRFFFLLTRSAKEKKNEINKKLQKSECAFGFVRCTRATININSVAIDNGRAENAFTVVSGSSAMSFNITFFCGYFYWS